MHKHVSLSLNDLKVFVKKYINLFKPECEIEFREIKLKQLECQFNQLPYDGFQLLLLKLVAKELGGDTLNCLFQSFCNQFSNNTDVQDYKANVNNGSFAGSSFLSTL